MSRWIDAMLPAERDELIDAGRIGPSRFDGPEAEDWPDDIDTWKAYRDAGLAESELRYLGGDK